MLSRPLMTTQEVAELLKVKEATVRKWIRDGELPAIQFHREWRIAVRHLEEFVAERLTIAERPRQGSDERGVVKTRARGRATSRRRRSSG